jgi:hypothetical protein
MPLLSAKATQPTELPGDKAESGRYKETEIRVEFIDPFFKALGWDVHNEQGYADLRPVLVDA